MWYIFSYTVACELTTVTASGSTLEPLTKLWVKQLEPFDRTLKE